MALQTVLTTLALPPVALVLAALGGGLLARRGLRRGGTAAALAAALLLLLATPLGAGLLRASLEREVPPPGPVRGGESPGAIVVLGAEIARVRAGGVEVGPLTLERLRAGAALHRRTGLPVLVTGGPAGTGEPPLAALMAASLAEDFGVAVRWVEPRARDTRENVGFGAAMLRAEGIGSAYVVTHGWHLPRTLASFARQEGFSAVGIPVRINRIPDVHRPSSWVPRADHLGTSWLALREWAGRIVYGLRD